jgi:hypothetical protein
MTLGVLLGASTIRLATAEDIVEIYDKIYFTMLNPDTNETMPVFTSEELYSFPWNTNVRFC